MRKKDSSDCGKISAIYLPSHKREDEEEEEEGKTSNYTIMVEKEKALLKRLID